VSESNRASSAGNQATLDEIDIEMAEADAALQAERANAPPPKRPYSGNRSIPTIQLGYGQNGQTVAKIVKVTRPRPAFLILFKMLPSRARRRAPRRHAVQRAGAESGDSDGGSSSDGDLGPSLHREAGQ